MQRAGGVAESRVDGRGVIDANLRCRHQVAGIGLGFADGVQGRLGGVDQALSVRQPLVLSLQFGQRFAIAGEGFQFGDVVTQFEQPRGPRGSRGLPVAQRGVCAVPVAKGCCDRLRQPVGSGVAVEELALHLGPRQHQVGVLPVYVDQLFGRFTQLRQSCRSAVDGGARPAAGVDHTAQQQQARLIGAVVVV